MWNFENLKCFSERLSGKNGLFSRAIFGMKSINEGAFLAILLGLFFVGLFLINIQWVESKLGVKNTESSLNSIAHHSYKKDGEIKGRGENMDLESKSEKLDSKDLTLTPDSIHPKPLKGLSTPYDFVSHYALFLKDLGFFVLILLYILAGSAVFKACLDNLKNKIFFDENVLMSVATIAALCIGEIAEAVAVMIFFRIGEFLESKALKRSKNSINKLLELIPQVAHVCKKDEIIEDIHPKNVHIGEEILIKVGESVPLDGVIIRGESFLDTSTISGEAKPMRVGSGSEILAGSINLSVALHLRVTQEFENTQIAKIKAMIESASENKSKTQRLISHFTGIYTPIMFFVALCVAVLPPLFYTFFGLDVASFLDFGILDSVKSPDSGALNPIDTNARDVWREWIYRSLVILMVSCPCALVLAVPLGYFGALGIASRRGVLFKGSVFLESLARVKAVVFDKTGTLTQGIFKINAARGFNSFSESEVLKLGICAQRFSNHPIAKAFLESGVSPFDLNIVKHQEIAGRGVVCEAISNQDLSDPTVRRDFSGRILVGNLALMREFNIDISRFENDSMENILAREGIDSAFLESGLIVHIALDDLYAGFVLINDVIKEEASSVIKNLRQIGVKPLAILSGDNEKNVSWVAHTLGIKYFFANLLPTQKAEILEAIKHYMQKGVRATLEQTSFGAKSEINEHEDSKDTQAKSSGSRSYSIVCDSLKNERPSATHLVSFIGDGINDSLVLAKSDIGISIAGAGTHSSDVSKQSADVILTGSNLRGLLDAIKIAKKVRGITWQNIFFVLFVKLILIILGFFGLSDMWIAVFGDVGVALLALLNALRVVRVASN